MGKHKFIPPLPKTADELAERVKELESEAALRRERKKESMRKWRKRVRSGEIYED